MGGARPGRGGAPGGAGSGLRGARQCVPTSTCRAPVPSSPPRRRWPTADRLVMAYPGYGGGAVSPRQPRPASRCGVHPLVLAVPSVRYQATPGLGAVQESGAGRGLRPGEYGQHQEPSWCDRWCEVFVFYKRCFQNGGTEHHVLFQLALVIYPQPMQIFKRSSFRVEFIYLFIFITTSCPLGWS